VSLASAWPLGPEGRRPEPGVDRGLLAKVRDRLVVDGDLSAPTPLRVASALRAEGAVLGDHAVLAVVRALRDELVGAGPLAELLADPAVTDVLVNGPAEVWVDRGAGCERTPVTFADESEVEHLAKRLAASVGRRLDQAAPWCDVTMPDGTRLHAVLSPVSRRGTTLSLRVPARRAWTLHDLQEAGSLGPEGVRLLADLVAAKASFLVSGGTGTGKTTVLACLLGLVGPAERIVLVEDLPELVPEHPHVVSLSGRPPNVEGMGEVTLRDLVRQALRMRPDRLVVGECRGAEVVDLLAAMNTGHEGGCGTVHANSASDVPSRMEALGVTGGLGRDAVHAQLAAGVAAVVHLSRDVGGRRVVAEIGILERDVATGLVQVVPAYVRRGHDLVLDAGRGLDGPLPWSGRR
jgi:pilus assembly protein CpaF